MTPDGQATGDTPPTGGGAQGAAETPTRQQPADGVAVASAGHPGTAAQNIPQDSGGVHTSEEPSFLKDAPWGAIVVISGLIAIVVIFIFAIEHYKAASDVATATAGVSGVIAALVGAYFGIRGSSMAQEKAEKGRRAGGGGASGL
jgi:hypothetical protein